MNDIVKLLVVLSLAMLTGCGGTQGNNQPKSMAGDEITGTKPGYTGYERGRLKYGVYVPEEMESGRKYPLLIYLHGWGQNQEVHLDWYEADIQEKHPCFVYTPRTPVEWGDWSGWSDRLSEPMQMAVEVLDSLIHVYPIDTCRLYVYGISMGGEGTMDLLHKFQGRFAAAMSVCGGGKPRWAENIAMTPLWMFHGDSDEVNPVTLTRDVYEAMVENGDTTMRYTEYQGFGHDIWNRVTREPEWYDWMFSFSSCK